MHSSSSAGQAEASGGGVAPSECSDKMMERGRQPDHPDRNDCAGERRHSAVAVCSRSRRAVVLFSCLPSDLVSTLHRIRLPLHTFLH